MRRKLYVLLDIDVTKTNKQNPNQQTSKLEGLKSMPWMAKPVSLIYANMI